MAAKVAPLTIAINAFQALDLDHDCEVSLEELQLSSHARGKATLTWPTVQAWLGLPATPILTSLSPRDVDHSLSAWDCISVQA